MAMLYSMSYITHDVANNTLQDVCCLCTILKMPKFIERLEHTFSSH